MSEIQVLESIYPDFFPETNTDSFLRLEIPIQLGQPTTILIAPEDTTQCDILLTLSTLPPLLLHIVLSEAYPRHSPPEVKIRSLYTWLSPLLAGRLSHILQDMWQPGEEVLFDWVELIRGGEFLAKLDVIQPSGAIKIRHLAPERLGTFLTSYDDSARASAFSQSSYPCAVCLTTIKGSKCLQLACSHIFCRSCLFDYWSLCIEEGSVEHLGCPDPACIKIGRSSREEEIARVVSEDAVKRWRWLREKLMYEKDPTLVHCPLTNCQGPVPKPPDSESGSGGDRLRICPTCSFSFCAFCKRTWHGSVQECPISHGETVVLEYLASEENSMERKTMEQRFGKKILQRLVAQYHEDQLNKKWLADSTMACPGCGLNIEKSLGLSDSSVGSTLADFFSRCGTKLSAKEPYKHFSDSRNVRCYNKLFDFEAEDLEWEPF
ncbi:hypothetical protein FB45DRAFT_916314 [Roridomyces roridus]|uniref:RBR-type E3 ubiquitin transferase n=1 Tax=Roridomyces roridus TaxID=1738132 RepID=A0AAD7FNN4_9AGAR|nr:hypothetical protein FB45DRAFT_916314 [Roridomyces roridus]